MSKNVSLEIFIHNIERERKKDRKGTMIEVVDGKEIERKCGKGYLKAFEPFLISARCEIFLLVFRPKEDSFWYSINQGGLAVNLASLPDKGTFETSDRDASEVEAELKARHV